MTTTSVYQGKEDGRNTSRVLRPPGGGSSNIFGAPTTESSTPQKAPNYQKSDIFGDGASNTQAQAKTSSNGKEVTKDRLFGPNESNATPPTSKADTGDRIFGQPDAKDPKPAPQSKSQEEEEDEIKPETQAPTEEKQVDESNNNNKQSVLQQARVEPIRPKGGFNPITHETTEDSKANANPHTSTRVKQPPGGASTPLW